jgi:ATP-dependent DNA helicase RecG
MEYEFLKKNIFPDFNLGLVHGRLKPKEKELVMNKFKDKKYQILVATPVVEVGIDIPNAAIMLIEGAERFGLAQLHQLRGRVGRGQTQSYCFLFTNKEEADISERLKFFSKTQEGRLLAEKDMTIRGPGNIYGISQHGFMDLKIASFTDYELIKKTGQAVRYFMEHHDFRKFPELQNRVEKHEIEEITRD